MISNRTTRKNNRWLALSALSMGYFMVMVDQAVIPVLTPHLPANVGDAVWITSVYLLCTVVPMLVTGRLGDKFGQRTMYLVGLVVYALGLALAAVAPTMAVLVAARAIQGLGAAAFLPQAFSVIGRVFPSDARGPAFAAWGVVGSVGSLIGPVLAGALVDGWGWRAAFAAQAIACVVALGFAWAWIPRLSTTHALIDAPSVIISFIGLGALVYGIQSVSWSATLVGLTALVLFGLLQIRHGDEAFMPMSVFRNRNFTLGSIGIMAMGFAVAAQFIPLMFWLQDVRGVSGAEAGALVIPMSVAALILTPLVGMAVDKVDPKILAVMGFGTLAAAMVASWAMITGDHSTYWVLGISTLLGIGSAFIWAPNAATTLRTIPEEMAGAASGVYNTVRQVGSVVGVALIGRALGLWVPEHGLATASANSMLLLAVAMVAGVVASFFLRSDIPARNR